MGCGGLSSQGLCVPVPGADRGDQASHSALHLAKPPCVCGGGQTPATAAASEPQMKLCEHFSCPRGWKSRSHSDPLEFKAREVGGTSELGGSFRALKGSLVHLQLTLAESREAIICCVSGI